MITKIEAAEKQLDTAIKLFFENIDHLSAYALAAASCEMTDDLCEKRETEIYSSELERLGDPQKIRLSFRYEMEILIKPEHLKEAMRLFNKTKNFLKHADRDQDQVLEDFSVEKLAFVIFWGIKNFVLLEKRWTPAMSIFFGWFGAKNPNLLMTDQDNEYSRLVMKMKEDIPDLSSTRAFILIHESLKKHAAYLFPKQTY